MMGEVFGSVVENWVREVGVREMVVTGKREKWIVRFGREERMEVVRGSRAVLEEGTRMPILVAVCDMMAGTVGVVVALLVC